MYASHRAGLIQGQMLFRNHVTSGHTVASNAQRSNSMLPAGGKFSRNETGPKPDLTAARALSNSGCTRSALARFIVDRLLELT
jgi:hypothetical protein